METFEESQLLSDLGSSGLCLTEAHACLEVRQQGRKGLGGERTLGNRKVPPKVLLVPRSASNSVEGNELHHGSPS